MVNSIIEESYGKWKSFITTKEVAQKSVNYGDVHIDNGRYYWTESRPKEGRTTIVSCDQERNCVDEIDAQFNISTDVHGYGGGAFLVKNAVIYFYDSLKAQVWTKNIVENKLTQVTNEVGYSYADFSVDENNQLLYCLRLNKNSDKKFPITEIVQINLNHGGVEVFVTGADFYSNVRVNEKGNKILFLQWNYPNMPWDENELYTLTLNHSFKPDIFMKMNASKGVSCYQPEWVGEEIYGALNENNYW